MSAKPFRPQELFRAVEQIQSTKRDADEADALPTNPDFASRQCAAGEADGDPQFDRDEALERVGGSEAILRELVELFRVECPKQWLRFAARGPATCPVWPLGSYS